MIKPLIGGHNRTVHLDDVRSRAAHAGSRVIADVSDFDNGHAFLEIP